MISKEDFLKEEIRNNYKISSDMKKTWNIQIEMLEEVKRICEKYNINYFADSGTLLGAIRHKGFIPWDDDIDLGMLREDYNKFIKVAKEELDKRFFLQINATEINNFFRNHAQIRYTNSTMLTKCDYKRKHNRGIFIDIFIYDKVPLDNNLDMNFRKNLYIRKKLLDFATSPLEPLNLKSYVKKALGLGNILFGGKKKAKFNFESMAVKYNKLQDNYYYDVVSYYLISKKLVFTKHIFEGEYIEVPFEYTTIRIPKMYDEYLKIMYGNDYMTPVQAPSDHGGLFIDNDNHYSKYNNLSKKEFMELFH